MMQGNATFKPGQWIRFDFKRTQNVVDSFMADILLPDGTTVGQFVLPQLESGQGLKALPIPGLKEEG